MPWRLKCPLPNEQIIAVKCCRFNCHHAVLVVGDGLAAAAAAQVRGYSRAFVENFDGGGRGANLHQFVHQVIRHAVEVRVEGDMIVDVDASAGSLAQAERPVGKGFTAGLSSASHTLAPVPSFLRN